MKQYPTAQLLQDCKQIVQQSLEQIQDWERFSKETLQLRPAAKAWSVAEVLEHVNSYHNHYIPAMQKGMAASSKAPAATFSGSWLGNYFTKLMSPQANGLPATKMPSPSPHNFLGKALDPQQVLSEYRQHQHALLSLLDQAAKANLESIKIPTTLSKWVKLSLGDTLRFLLAHQRRHAFQVERTLSSVSQQTG
jgi:uncharacterized damage-inducible protein DinB